MMWARKGHLDGGVALAHFEPGGLVDDCIAYDEEGEDDPEYPRTSAAEGWRKICAGILATLLGLVLIFAFFAAVAGLSQYIGGPTE